MSTFSTLTTVRLGIYAAQKGLDVTGNNITNINTVGYSRQALEQSSLASTIADKYYSRYSPKVGQGVVIEGVTQLRDPALDITYRNAMSDVGSMDAKLAGLESIASILDEVGKGSEDQDDGVILNQMNALRDIINRANTDGIDGYDALIRTTASSLVALFNSYSEKLSQLETTYENYIDQDVDTINTHLEEIQKLNISIRNAEIRGDDALELRDERNRLLDSLSQYAKIDVRYETEILGAGFEVEKITVDLSDENLMAVPGGRLIDGVYAAQIYTGTLTDPSANNYMVTVETLKTVDGEQLDPTATDEVLDDNDLFGSLQSIREFLTEKGEFATAADQAIDPFATEKKGLPYYQNMLDSFANEFANAMNALNNPGTGITGEGNLFSVSSNTNNTTDASGGGITAGNLSISAGWADGNIKLLATTDPSAPSGDTTNLSKFLAVFNDTHTFDPTAIDPDALGAAYEGTFEDMLYRIQSTMAEEQMSSMTVLSNYSITAENVYVQRDGVMGVDLNDEATYLMTYQKAYSAAARLMTIIDEVLETLIHS